MSSIEIKSAGDEIVADLNRAFSAFKEANDERLAQIETRMSADVVTEEKLARIDQALDETKSPLDRLALDLSRPRLGGAVADDHGAREHKSAFNHYMRSGEAGGLKALEAKAMSRTSGPDGGYLVPVPAEREILRRLARFSRSAPSPAYARFRRNRCVAPFPLPDPRRAGWRRPTRARKRPISSLPT